HPQSTTHALKKRGKRHIPILLGCPVPRRDIDGQCERYAVTMLSLFKPWARAAAVPLKEATIGWTQAFDDLMQHISPSLMAVMDHMHEQWECRDAAADFSA
ncbi:hypothetical protein BDZ89DRAFT_897519, partial [Hymenopellis radicata]